MWGKGQVEIHSKTFINFLLKASKYCHSPHQQASCQNMWPHLARKDVTKYENAWSSVKCAWSCKQSRKLLLSINKVSNLFVIQIESRTKRGLNRKSVPSTVVPDQGQSLSFLFWRGVPKQWGVSQFEYIWCESSNDTFNPLLLYFL